MVEVPKPSDIQNVFAMSEPQHMVSKLYFEILKLMDSMSVWTKSEAFPEPVFIAYNAAITAWHITDWLWQSRVQTRDLLAKRFKFSYNEWSRNGRRTGLEQFQKAVATDFRPLYICQEIANGSKHMRRTKSDADIKAIAEWHPAVEAVGHVKVGDLVLSLNIFDGDKKWDAMNLFIKVAGYWEKLLTSEKLITAEARLPDKIIRAQQQLPA